MSLLVVIYVALIAIVLFATSRIVPITRAEDFAKLAGVGVAAVSGLMAFVGSLVSMKAARELEQLKAAEARGTEQLKLVVAQRIAAWSAMATAASFYYRTLADLERGKWDEARVATAEEGMVEAEGHFGRLSDQADRAFGNLWQTFWQAARRIGELAAERQGGEDLRALWRAEGTQLGEHLQGLQEAERDLLASLEPTRR